MRSQQRHGSSLAVWRGSALEAVRKWKFVPVKRSDVAEASWATVPIQFELD